MAFVKGGPTGSMATIALTSEGLSSASGHPFCPD